MSPNTSAQFLHQADKMSSTLKHEVFKQGKCTILLLVVVSHNVNREFIHLQNSIYIQSIILNYRFIIEEYVLHLDYQQRDLRSIKHMKTESSI